MSKDQYDLLGLAYPITLEDLNNAYKLCDITTFMQEHGPVECHTYLNAFSCIAGHLKSKRGNEDLAEHKHTPSPTKALDRSSSEDSSQFDYDHIFKTYLKTYDIEIKKKHATDALPAEVSAWSAGNNSNQVDYYRFLKTYLNKDLQSELLELAKKNERLALEWTTNPEFHADLGDALVPLMKIYPSIAEHALNNPFSFQKHISIFSIYDIAKTHNTINPDNNDRIMNLRFRIMYNALNILRKDQREFGRRIDKLIKETEITCEKPIIIKKKPAHSEHKSDMRLKSKLNTSVESKEVIEDFLNGNICDNAFSINSNGPSHTTNKAAFFKYYLQEKYDLSVLGDLIKRDETFALQYIAESKTYPADHWNLLSDYWREHPSVVNQVLQDSDLSARAKKYIPLSYYLAGRDKSFCISRLASPSFTAFISGKKLAYFAKQHGADAMTAIRHSAPTYQNLITYLAKEMARDSKKSPPELVDTATSIHLAGKLMLDSKHNLAALALFSESYAKGDHQSSPAALVAVFHVLCPIDAKKESPRKSIENPWQHPLASRAVNLAMGLDEKACLENTRFQDINLYVHRAGKENAQWLQYVPQLKAPYDAYCFLKYWQPKVDEKKQIACIEKLSLSQAKEFAHAIRNVEHLSYFRFHLLMRTGDISASDIIPDPGIISGAHIDKFIENSLYDTNNTISKERFKRYARCFSNDILTQLTCFVVDCFSPTQHHNIKSLLSYCITYFSTDNPSPNNTDSDMMLVLYRASQEYGTPEKSLLLSEMLKSTLTSTQVEALTLAKIDQRVRKYRENKNTRDVMSWLKFSPLRDRWAAYNTLTAHYQHNMPSDTTPKESKQTTLKSDVDFIDDILQPLDPNKQLAILEAFPQLELLSFLSNLLSCHQRGNTGLDLLISLNLRDIDPKHLIPVFMCIQGSCLNTYFQPNASEQKAENNEMTALDHKLLKNTSLCMSLIRWTLDSWRDNGRHASNQNIVKILQHFFNASTSLLTGEALASLFNQAITTPTQRDNAPNAIKLLLNDAVGNKLGAALLKDWMTSSKMGNDENCWWRNIPSVADQLLLIKTGAEYKTLDSQQANKKPPSQSSKKETQSANDALKSIAKKRANQTILFEIDEEQTNSVFAALERRDKNQQMYYIRQFPKTYLFFLTSTLRYFGGHDYLRFSFLMLCRARSSSKQIALAWQNSLKPNEPVDPKKIKLFAEFIEHNILTDTGQVDTKKFKRYSKCFDRNVLTLFLEFLSLSSESTDLSERKHTLDQHQSIKTITTILTHCLKQPNIDELTLATPHKALVDCLESAPSIVAPLIYWNSMRSKAEILKNSSTIYNLLSSVMDKVDCNHVLYKIFQPILQQGNNYLSQIGEVLLSDELDDSSLQKEQTARQLLLQKWSTWYKGNHPDGIKLKMELSEAAEINKNTPIVIALLCDHLFRINPSETDIKPIADFIYVNILDNHRKIDGDKLKPYSSIFSILIDQILQLLPKIHPSQKNKSASNQGVSAEIITTLAIHLLNRPGLNFPIYEAPHKDLIDCLRSYPSIAVPLIRWNCIRNKKEILNNKKIIQEQLGSLMQKASTTPENTEKFQPIFLSLFLRQKNGGLSRIRNTLFPKKSGIFSNPPLSDTALKQLLKSYCRYFHGKGLPPAALRLAKREKWMIPRAANHISSEWKQQSHSDTSPAADEKINRLSTLIDHTMLSQDAPVNPKKIKPLAEFINDNMMGTNGQIDTDKFKRYAHCFNDNVKILFLDFLALGSKASDSGENKETPNQSQPVKTITDLLIHCFNQSSDKAPHKTLIDYLKSHPSIAAPLIKWNCIQSNKEILSNKKIIQTLLSSLMQKTRATTAHTKQFQPVFLSLFSFQEKACLSRIRDILLPTTSTEPPFSQGVLKDLLHSYCFSLGGQNLSGKALITAEKNGWVSRTTTYTLMPKPRGGRGRQQARVRGATPALNEHYNDL